MISHNRLEYLKKAVAGVLNQTYKDFRLLIWDNQSDTEVSEWLQTLDDPRIGIHFNKTNDSLASVTSTVFLRSDSEFVAKIDSDTLVPPEWAERLVKAHQDYHFGFIGGFHFRPEDLEKINPNIEKFNNTSIWQKHHIGGCAFMIRREDFKGYDGAGLMGLSEYQAEMGFPNGYLWDPILYVDHMEDARSEHYISTEEYAQYKLKTRGVGLARYQAGIVHEGYMKENTK